MKPADMVVVMDVVTEMDLKTLLLNSEVPMAQYVLDKHGQNAYCGQS